MPQYCRVVPFNWRPRRPTRPTCDTLNPKIRQALPYMLSLTAFLFAYILGRTMGKPSDVPLLSPRGICGAMVDSISQTCDVVQFPMEFFDISSDYLGPGVMTASDKFLFERYVRRKMEEEEIRIVLQALRARIVAQRTHYLQTFYTYLRTNYISIIYYIVLHLTVAVVVQSYTLRKFRPQPQPQPPAPHPAPAPARNTVPAPNNPLFVHVRATNLLTHQHEPKATALETRVESLERRLGVVETRDVRRGSPPRSSRSPSPTGSDDESEVGPSRSATPQLLNC
ncbi:hypothetical protein SISNIDRAFT_483174 [Sistotremastrum niveocremeum HHB9708]|uniref:Uncharacterized protein n=1 Tax=Sistotremastrum niveocremeum HHB9708 TaxID=1314777 RepID=A0A164X8U3_9AGAM|nr:hypothetical protein SISNIDRAFT_483174 [Sistotremastrum niveocremeum HHB9708]